MSETPNTQTPGADPDDAIAALKPSVVKSLKSQREELIAHRERILADDINDQSRQAMRFTVHAMRGTASAHFFPEIAEAAGPLERAIVAGDAMNDDGFLAWTDSLISLCDAALNKEEAA